MELGQAEEEMQDSEAEQTLEDKELEEAEVGRERDRQELAELASDRTKVGWTKCKKKV